MTKTANGSNYTKNNLRYFSRSQGIKCTSRDQPKSSPSCEDYQARFCCPRQPETQLDYGECEGPGKTWTEWSSIDTPHDSMGDFERYRKKERNELVYMKCDGATAWQGRTETGERTSQDRVIFLEILYQKQGLEEKSIFCFPLFSLFPVGKITFSPKNHNKNFLHFSPA